MKQSKKIAILGEGAWGTALATVYASNGHQVSLWCHHPEIANEIMSSHVNTRYMPGIGLPKNIVATADLSEALTNVDFICEAIPVQYLRSVVELAKPYVHRSVPWIITSKGIEEKTLFLPSQIVTDVLGYEAFYGVCMGPSFAHEVVLQQKTGLVIAARDHKLQHELRMLIENSWLTVEMSSDVIGLQLCAAFKNVAAFLVGVSDGVGNGDNARALLVTHCFQKMIELVTAAGGSLDTVHGLGGFGDLFLTATSTQSRNYKVGKEVGTGKSLDMVLKETGFIPEGVNTLRSIVAYAQKYNVELSNLPIHDYVK